MYQITAPPCRHDSRLMSSILISKQGNEVHTLLVAGWSLLLFFFFSFCKWSGTLLFFSGTKLVKFVSSQVTLSTGQGHTQRSLTEAQSGNFSWLPISAPPPPFFAPLPSCLCRATSWAAKSIPVSVKYFSPLCLAKQVWIPATKCWNWTNVHNPVDLPYVGGRRGGVAYEDIARGLVWLSHLPVYGMHKPTDGFSRGFVVVYNEKKIIKMRRHSVWLGNKINVFVLQMAHKGILIYSVLWCITAQSDISNGVGVCSGKLVVLALRTAKWDWKSSCYLAAFLLNQIDRNWFLGGWVRLDRYYMLCREDEFSDKHCINCCIVEIDRDQYILKWPCYLHPIHYVTTWNNRFVSECSIFQ